MESKVIKLFIVMINYKVPLETIDLHREAHIEFLDQYYLNHTFITSGPLTPRTGGVILSKGESKQEIYKIFEKDPFKIEELADYTIFEFTPTQFTNNFKTTLNAISD